MKLVLFSLLGFAAVLRAADPTDAAESLAKACVRGDFKTVEGLLSSGVNANLPDRYGHSPLYNAVSFNNAQIALLLLASHADPNIQPVGRKSSDVAPATPLQYAVELGNVHLASALISAGAQVNAAGPSGRTALHFAGKSRLDLMELLLDKGADINARDVDGASALDYAVWRGSLDVVAILLARGAPLNQIEPKTGATPINEAAFRGNEPLVRYLLQFHPDLNIPDRQGFRPFDNAARMGRENVARVLLAAEPRERDTPDFFHTAMLAAVRKDESALVGDLLHRGASSNQPLPSGATPLDAAAAIGAGKTVNVLLAANADPNNEGRNGTTPLEDASLKGFASIAAALLEHGAQPNHINTASGTTALYAAASFGKTETVKLLLEHSARPNLCGNGKRTPYQVAAENGYPDVAALLKAQGGSNTCEHSADSRSVEHAH